MLSLAQQIGITLLAHDVPTLAKFINEKMNEAFFSGYNLRAAEESNVPRPDEEPK